MTLTLPELQKEIEFFCAEDARQARAYRAQREISDRYRGLHSECIGKLELFESNQKTAEASAAERATLEERRKTDAVAYLVGSGLALVAGVTASGAGLCWASGKSPELCAGLTAGASVALAGTVLVYFWRW